MADNHDVEYEPKTKTTLTTEIRHCLRAARREGYTGPDADYQLTASDCEAIVAALGRKPTRAEWTAAGVRWIGDAHIADASED